MYIIDGVWRHNPNEPTETDSNGNINNVFEVPEYLPSESQHSDQESQPEPNTFDSQADQTSEPTEDKDLINTAVFPTQSPQRIPSTSQSTPPSTRLPTKSMIGSRTHSLISQSRSRHTSYHSPSFLGSTIAPGTPTEKSTPAQTSVSTVVSAMAGAAATAIPAAIFAVTGKDIIRNRSSSASASARSMPVSINKANVDRNVSLPNSTPGQKLKSDIQEPLPILLTLNDPKENDEVVKGKSEVDTHLQLEPSQQDRSEPKVESIETQVQEVQDPKPEPELIGGGALQAIEETGSEVSQNDKPDTKSKEELINQSTSVTDLPSSTEAVVQPPTSENIVSFDQPEHEGESQVGDDPNTPVRKRKTSLFQKIKVALSPGSHGHRKTSESTE
ncbi:uncharacterized protein MELLADRAFT_65153 [Melampsora larici-populina 98AG31]|uniref:AMP-activated protein kinase glycogen-binding domain-containing protein n=1 Tax=Melampsora larici-populina (strain 98AG31 / pathotype 3-4-7) TaxID=747676 RepID=F4RU58_MELLP|nr:uncharacterized protein MELLADRAFT_65153 [Melampsora larici-populina 98AG31]EGG04119.1 hypothetical protein MELLADRAFT_65153 [Melampsora larici-populina 98AG31]